MLYLRDGTYSHTKVPCGMSCTARTPQPFLLVLKSWSRVLEDTQTSLELKSELLPEADNYCDTFTSKPELCRIIATKHLEHNSNTTEVVSFKTVKQTQLEVTWEGKVEGFLVCIHTDQVWVPDSVLHHAVLAGPPTGACMVALKDERRLLPAELR